MTERLRTLWIAVYAASWHVPMGAPMGRVTDEMRAIWCAVQADRAVEALVKSESAKRGTLASEVVG